jgi:YegS/Rv2252/BmrU family lipid kinase
MTHDETDHGSTETSDAGPSADADRCRVVLNPVSGTEDHVAEVDSRAEERGYAVRETESEGDAAALAREAAEDGVEVVAACGGDGTVHEVVRGVDQADALDDVTCAVVPGGTGNSFAGNVGVTSIADAFELIETGERRRIDLGVADGEPFANSCIAGLTAQTSSETDSEQKSRFGRLAYVLAGLRQAAEFDPLHTRVESGEAGSDLETWEGDALALLVGNARRFAGGGGQADVEDGQLEVTIVEEMPTNDLLAEAPAYRLFGRETEHITHLTASSLEIESPIGEDIEFSLDGEMSAHEALSLHVRPRALEVVVGPDYRPDPRE